MPGTSGVALLGVSFLLSIPGVRGETEAGIIAASVVAGVILLGGVIGVAAFCVHRNGGCNFEDEKPHKKRSHHKHKHRSNGVSSPPPPYHVDSRYIHQSNGYVRASPAPPAPPPQGRPVVYPTYHGPPPEFIEAQSVRSGTHSGPPTIVIPASFGTVTMRPDPRPVIKTRQFKPKEASHDDRRHFRSKSHDRFRDKPNQEFVIQQSYDGIPVIRPVIYLDDDEHRDRHRSKSQSRSKSRERKQHANVTTIPLGVQTADVHISDRDDRPASENHENPVIPRPKTPTPPPIPKRTPQRSRASSVTDALRKSTKDHVGNDSDSDSSKAPSFNWATTDRAPDPRAGDVMFFPAGTHSNADAHKQDGHEQVYGYTTVIKQSQRDSTKASVMIQEPEKQSTNEQPEESNGGYEVPRSSIRYSSYETEMSRTTGNFNDIGASMSDRLQYLVEDGDKTRFSKYNVGAINFGDEEKTETDEVQMRVRKRPQTPPADFPRDSFHSQRPATPPRDIPLITPRESTEIPPLDLQSSINSPVDFRQSLRPVTPPHDYPVSPTRPKTPPTDFQTPRPPTPPRDIDTSRSKGINILNASSRSQPVDPSTGDPGSFQARQRLIEAHLMKNVSPEKPGNEQSNIRKPEVPRVVQSSATETPSVAPVHVPSGVVPPAPPPPPLPR